MRRDEGLPGPWQLCRVVGQLESEAIPYSSTRLGCDARTAVSRLAIAHDEVGQPGQDSSLKKYPCRPLAPRRGVLRISIKSAWRSRCPSLNPLAFVAARRPRARFQAYRMPLTQAPQRQSGYDDPLRQRRETDPGQRRHRAGVGPRAEIIDVTPPTSMIAAAGAAPICRIRSSDSVAWG